MTPELWELRTARLEGAYEQIDRRLGAVEGRLSAVESRLSTVEQRIDAGFAQVHTEVHGEVGGLRNEMHRQFYWLMGAMGTVVALMVSGFIQVALKLGGH